MCEAAKKRPKIAENFLCVYYIATDMFLKCHIILHQNKMFLSLHIIHISLLLPFLCDIFYLYDGHFDRIMAFLLNCAELS